MVGDVVSGRKYRCNFRCIVLLLFYYSNFRYIVLPNLQVSPHSNFWWHSPTRTWPPDSFFQEAEAKRAERLREEAELEALQREVQRRKEVRTDPWHNFFLRKAKLLFWFFLDRYTTIVALGLWEIHDLLKDLTSHVASHHITSANRNVHFRCVDPDVFWLSFPPYFRPAGPLRAMHWSGCTLEKSNNLGFLRDCAVVHPSFLQALIAFDRATSAAAAAPKYVSPPIPRVSTPPRLTTKVVVKKWPPDGQAFWRFQAKCREFTNNIMDKYSNLGGWGGVQSSCQICTDTGRFFSVVTPPVYGTADGPFDPTVL